jgi:hypothetical protein
MSSSFVAKIAGRYAPFNFSNILGYPNAMASTKDWANCLPRFREEKDECLVDVWTTSGIHSSIYISIYYNHFVLAFSTVLGSLCMVILLVILVITDAIVHGLCFSSCKFVK